MVRWKKSRRQTRLRVSEDVESSEESGESEDDENRLHDGEDEDNCRDSLIRLAYISVIILAIAYGPLILLAILFIEISVNGNNESRFLLQEKRLDAGLRIPPMAVILEDSSRFRYEIKYLKTCNAQLTYITWINVLLELFALAYSLLLLSIERRYLYPSFQLFLHWYTRTNQVSSEVYTRFFAPEDVVGGLVAEIFHDIIIRIPFTFKHVFTDYVSLIPCPLELLIFPLILAVLQVFAHQKHRSVYENERMMRKQIRDRFTLEGPLHFYTNF